MYAELNERRDESVLGVAFFKRYGQDHAEVGCLAIHRDYRKVFMLFMCTRKLKH